MDVALDIPMGEMVFLTTCIYQVVEDARDVLDTIQAMDHEKTITVIDAAMLTRLNDGKLRVEETTQVTTGKGAKRGAVVAGVLGLVFPPSLVASAVVGAGVGALVGRVRDTGIKKDQLQRIADELEPGNAAVIVLAKAGSQPLIVETLKARVGQLLVQDLGPDTSFDLATIGAALPPERSDWPV